MSVYTRLLGRRFQGTLVLALAAIGAFALPGSAFAAHGSSAAVGHVYLDGNTAGANTIAAYDRAPDGSLTPTPGSPFSAGGAGLGTGLGSQGAIQTAENGRFVLAVDAGSNQVSVLRTNPDGSLTQAPGSPVSSDGVKPVSIAVHGDLVYVANDGDATHSANYTGFVLTAAGQLVPLPNSTVNAPGAANDLGDVLFNSNGRKLVGTEVASSQIDSFQVDGRGYLDAAPGSPFAGQGLGAFGSAFRPTSPHQLFVSNPHNVGNDVGTVSAFDVGGNGELSSIGDSPFGDLQNAPCWVAITPDGQYLFAVNTASGTVSGFSINQSGDLTLLGSTPVNDNGGVGGTDATTSPDGQNLYINETAAHGVAEMAINGGTLTELSGSPVALPASITASAGAASN
ncbi:MAG TPA: beta-propeller fold lactonase family protein [Solirubrobacteraceae bacterium]|jgi:6-phosphogluconolactonase (cycloisomerase 2 family)|nr:beta-propeller fold lactonase family protein [Solirubrobacteraceae bacterium]